MTLKKVNAPPIAISNIDFKSMVRLAFETYKKYLAPFFILLTLNFAIRFSELKLEPIIKERNLTLFSFILQILIFVITTYLTALVMKTGLLAVDHIKIDKSKNLLISAKTYLKKIVSDIIINILVFGGLFLLIVPGLIAAIRLQFAGYELLEKNISVLESLKNSWIKTQGFTLKLFYTESLLLIVNLVCLTFLTPALYLTFPIFILVQSYLYRTLYKSASK